MEFKYKLSFILIFGINYLMLLYENKNFIMFLNNLYIKIYNIKNKTKIIKTNIV